MNTAAFQRAVTAAAGLGSAVQAACVVVTDGQYLSGNLPLLSNVYLNVTPSAKMLGSSNVTDYPRSMWAFVSAVAASNIGIVGGGTLDGQYEKYIVGWDEPNDQFVPQGWPDCTGECRPRLVQLVNSSNIVIQNVTLTNSSDWTFHLLGCDNVFVSQLTQYGDSRWPNNDGIDIDSSRNVTVLDSSFDTGDDAVCIKSTAGYGVVNDVLVRNVTLRSRSGAIKFGSATDEDCYNLTFTDVVIHDSNRGLGIQQRGAGDVRDVLFANVRVETRRQPPTWWGSGEPIYASSLPRAPNDTVGRIVNITFANISGRAEGAAMLSGRAPGHVVAGVTLRNVTLLIDKWSNVTAPGVHDYRPTTVFADMQLAPVDGIYVEAVDGLLLQDVAVTFNASNPQPDWSGVCFNTSNAGAPVTTQGCICTPP